MSSSSIRHAMIISEISRMPQDQRDKIRQLASAIKEEIRKTNLYYIAFDMARLELELSKGGIK